MPAVEDDSAIALARKAKAAGIKHGVVQDKVFLPGLVKLRLLRDSAFFGRILAVREALYASSPLSPAS